LSGVSQPNAEAIEALDRALKIDPEYIDAWYIKGLALISLHKYKEAITAWDQTIRIDPGKAVVWYNKGIALFHLEKKYEDAIKAYDQVKKISPKDTDASHFANPAYFTN
jgi:tetratricopeptide (TPR) repeat protein